MGEIRVYGAVHAQVVSDSGSAEEPTQVSRASPLDSGTDEAPNAKGEKDVTPGRQDRAIHAIGSEEKSEWLLTRP